MSIVDSAAARILTPLSALLQKPLAISDDPSVDVVAPSSVRVSSPSISIRAQDGQPFSETERQFLHEVFELIRMAEESETRFLDLERRLVSLQRENLDLVVRNRVLSEVSSRDALTGLYNRWYVMEKIDTEINRSLRHGSPMALLMLDLDHFKRINDTWGHAVGDQVLQAVGRVLRESCRVYDVPGRYGGEEFCIVLPETRLGNTVAVAERIRGRLADKPLSFGDATLIVTTSIGIAGMESTESSVISPAALIERADRALYIAKNRGRNRVETWDSRLVCQPNRSESTNH
ncbi:MAG TPA: GGDEF domain-containing protein [Thermoanaerobaculia bacterium]|nr:GGDEF domain-containing protein [Thermoanaerobaculia bacterium]